MALPVFDAGEVYDMCVGSIANENTRKNFQTIRESMLQLGKTYLDNANMHQLHQIEPINLKDDEQCIEQITKKDLVDLYTQQFTGQKKPARAVYDRLLISAPNGRCPFCGFGQASTLDHFLPKAKYFWLSVFVPNLVPACKDCNSKKSTKLANSVEKQTLHPYFDDLRIENEQWLFADIQDQNSYPIPIRYYTKPPLVWDESLKLRVSNHFRDFELAPRFSLEAANELATLTSVLKTLSRCGSNQVKEHLDLIFQSEFSVRKNTWKSALYQTLSESEWYWSGGHSI